MTKSIGGFENALAELKNGKCVRRIHWDNEVYLRIGKSEVLGQETQYIAHCTKLRTKEYQEWWNVSHVELLADDWEVIIEDN